MDEKLMQRSILVRFLKSLILFANKILPQVVVQKYYNRAFALYRRAQRLLFLRHWMYAKLKGDSDTLIKTRLVHSVMPYSLVAEGGLKATCNLAFKIEQEQLKGAFVECGVAEGGCSALLGLVSKHFKSNRDLWMFDSYEGLPNPTSEDFIAGATGNHIRPLPPGSCRGTFEQVEQLIFDDMLLAREHIHMIKGWFENTLPTARHEVGNIALLRIDADWYESVKCCLDNLYDSVVPGGYIVIDDYGTCFGARKALDEFLFNHELHVQLVSDGRGGCHFVKPLSPYTIE